MSTLELKKEFRQIIDNRDTNLADEFYNLITTYQLNSENSRMIIESEDDIKLGNIHSQYEIKKMIESWKE
jgi:hypothetical protein